MPKLNSSPVNLLSQPVTVPANFIGLSTGANLAAPNTITYSLVRNWDYYGDQGLTERAVMCYINPSAGTYFWTTLDELLNNNTGKDLIFTLGTPADYLVTRGAVGGAYLGGKSNMCPDNLSGWATAVQAVVSHIVAAGFTGVKYELWNEIDQAASYGDTVSLLGPYTLSTAQAVHAIDPTAKILSPSISGASHISTLTTYLTASDGASGTSATWLQGIAFHYYAQTNYQYDNPLNYVQSVSVVKGACTALGLKLPYWLTESGVLNTAPNQGTAWQWRLLTFAALGLQSFLGYQYGSATYPIQTFVSQWNQVAAILHPGAVISSFTPGVAGLSITVDGVVYNF